MGTLAIVIYIAFLALSLGLWIWLVVRIWKSSAVGAVLTFFLGLPALYFLIKNWGDEEHDISVPFFANLALAVLAIAAAVALPAYQGYALAGRSAEQQKILVSKSNPELERWCREQNNAGHSPDHGTCIEGDISHKAMLL